MKLIWIYGKPIANGTSNQSHTLLHMLNTQVIGSMMLIQGESISLKTIQVKFSLNTSTLNITTS
jgi:hypothetical protein